MAQVFDGDYYGSVARFREQLEQAVPWALQYGVQVGIQPHHGEYVSNVVGVLALLDGLPEDALQRYLGRRPRCPGRL